MTKRRWRLISRGLSYAVLGGAVLVALFPIFWTFSTSVKSRVDAFANPPKFFAFDATAKNYRAMFNDERFADIFWNTVAITVGSTLLCTAIGAPAAYALARHHRFPGRRTFEATLILVRALPGIILMIPLFQIVTRLGLYDDTVAMVVIYAAVNLPFAVWLLTGFLAQVPPEIEESARTDGAGRLRLFALIIFPLALPGVAATTIFVGLLAWNEFLIPAILAGEDSKTLPVYIAGFISARTLDWGPLAAASSLAIIPIALFTALIQRKLVSGLSSGALKE
jgi:ABC-type glycerol-3-phosphate transport system permease component